MVCHLQQCSTFRRLFVVIISVSLIVFHSSFVLATPSFTRQMNYQAKLTDANGVAVSDGTYNIEFKLYAASSGGSALWTETRTTTDRVQVTNGLFSVMLGSVTSLTSVDFNQTLYLSVNIGGTAATPSWDGEMTPRKSLGTVPAAFMAQGLEAVNPITVSSSSTTTLATFTQSGTGRIFDFISGARNVFTSLVSGFLGVGTTTPNNPLQIATSSRPHLVLSDPGAGTDIKHVYASTTLGSLTFGSLNDALSTYTERLRIDSSGRLGIGTTSPWGLLSVNPNGISGPAFVVGSSTQTDFIVTNGGNVGIGTANPTAKLTVIGGKAIIIDSTAAVNVVVGDSNTGASLQSASASGNTIFGSFAGNLLTTGDSNTFIGISAGEESTTGGYNVFVGAAAGQLGSGDNITNNVAIGNQANKSVSNCCNVYIGDSAGSNVNVGGIYNVLIGYAPTVQTGTGISRAIAIGASAYVQGTSSIAIGSSANATGPYPFVLGSDSSPVFNAYVNGVTDGSPLGFTLNAAGGSGTNIYGASTTIAGGKATGNAAGGSIVFSTSDAGASGTTLQSLSEKLRITASGFLGIGTTSPYSLLSISNSVGTTANTPLFTIASTTAGTATSTLLTVLASGNVGIGTSSPSSALSIEGTCIDTGAGCADIAELYRASEDTESGDIVAVDSNAPRSVKKATQESVLIGVVSTNPALVIEGSALQLMTGRAYSNDARRPAVALSGRVPAKVSLEHGHISIGDRITISSMPGVGMKADAGGASVGIALEPFDESSPRDDNGIGIILVFVNLGQQQLTAQNGSFDLFSINQDINLNGFLLVNVKAIESMSGLWRIDENGTLVIKEVHAEKVKTKELCVGEACINEDILKKLLNIDNLEQEEPLVEPLAEPPSDVVDGEETSSDPPNETNQ